MSFKSYFILILFVWVSFYQGVVQAQRKSSKIIDVSVSDVYVPIGFDDNDTSVQVVFEGFFPNNCHKVAKPVVEIVDHVIHIQPKAYLFEPPCLMVMSHFSRVVDLEMLEAGDYEIKILKGGVERKILLPIKRSQPLETSYGPDDFPYAPVKSARVISKEPLVIRLEGEFLNSCMAMDYVNVPEVTNNVINILPIAKLHAHGKVCAEVIVPFVQDVQIEQRLKGRFLFHIRSFNGSAINILKSL